MDVIKYPSVLEANNVELKNVARDLVSGMNIIHEDQSYLVGDLALSEGFSPQRNINSAPDEDDYRVILKSALLIAGQKLGSPISLTVGFPFSTYQVYKDKAESLILKEHVIEFDTNTYRGGGRKKVALEVERLEVMPEVVGCAIGVRNSEPQATGNFFMLSLGYGTFEAILSTVGGVVQRSSVSTYGVRYAVNLMTQELIKEHYLDLKNEHQIDLAFSQGFIFLNRKRIDLTEIRRKVLKQYYQSIISPALRKAFSDQDFAKSQEAYLGGGGANYEVLVNLFKEEFDGILNVHVPPNPEKLASLGYCHHSAVISGGAKDRAVGLDIGNSSTIVTTFKQEKIEAEAE
ncbi:ParM/StbA family protein [Litoribacter populi]|uniref:ParM/StbA family protein n=1 Tax=Litoribacter populi TaxID=2598460 RepID=UPI00117CF4D7|nr:ParM/StbA family protein [Litoribacter populi]